jgi:DNA repair protein RadC
MHHIEDVIHDLVLGMRASMLRSLERRPAVFAESHDLPVEHDLPHLLPPRRSHKAGVHRGQVLVVPGADLNMISVLDQEGAVAVPFEFIQPLVAFGQLLDAERRHRREEGGSLPMLRRQPVPASPDDIIAAAREHLSRRLRRGTSLSSPQAARDFLAVKLGAREFESFCCLFLDNRHRLIEFAELFRGTIDSAAVYPREVVKEALKRNAAALVLAHQHPSGVAEVSAADQLITRKLVSALETL